MMTEQRMGFLPAAQRPPRLLGPWRTLRSIGALVLREMTTTYGRSVGGYLWALLEPIGSITMLTLVITSGLRLQQPALGVSFVLFYATGMLVFALYVRTQQKVSSSLTYSRALLRYPAVRFFDAVVARFTLNVVTQMLVMTIVFGGILLLFETRSILDFRWILLAIAMASALALGIGLVNALLMPLFPIYASIFGILTTPLFFISGIFFLFEEIPPFAQEYLWYNPLIHVTGMMRRGFYGQYAGEFISPMYVFSISLVLMVLGYILVSRFHRVLLGE